MDREHVLSLQSLPGVRGAAAKKHTVCQFLTNLNGIADGYESHRARGSLLMSALLWTMISPVLNSLCIRLENGNPIPD
jgi:hypothetical protein